MRTTFKQFCESSDTSFVFDVAKQYLEDGKEVLADFTIEDGDTSNRYVGTMSFDGKHLRAHGTVYTTLKRFDNKISTGKVSDTGVGLPSMKPESADEKYTIKMIDGKPVVVDFKD